ncbi:hypothetical protein AGMMS49992_25490 [Clostridia bacterium]|nr:hypothetical protein AGMMS49992_25490 [Clostridia bacterium]
MVSYEKIIDMWRGWHVATVSDIDCRLDNFRILFAFNSTKIENDSITYFDTRELFENGRVLNYTGDPRALFELGNQKLCYEYLKHKIAAREPLSKNIVLETHCILTSGTYDARRFIERGERPGAFKKHDYVTGRAEVGATPDEAPQAVMDLLEELKEMPSDGQPDSKPFEAILKAAAYFHASFEHIHPFADGNGRVGRTLTNYFLMIHNHPPVIVYDEDKALYYKALESYDSDEVIRPMCDFLRSETVKTWGLTLDRETRQ